MDFTGRVFFDFDTIDVWRLYATALKAASSRGVRVELAWEPFLVGEIDPDREVPGKIRALAACAAVAASHPGDYLRFVQAMLTLIYQEKDDPRKDVTLAVAARVAGIDADLVLAGVLDPGLDLLVAGTANARELGVSGVPTIVRSGPPVMIRTTGAATQGNAVRRLELINHMLDDDGIWSMTKP